jgi:hypothetical protein
MKCKGFGLKKSRDMVSIWKHVVSPFSHCSLPPAKVSSDWTRPGMMRKCQPMAARETKSSGPPDQQLLRSRRRMRRQNLNVPSRVVSRGEETQTRTFGRNFSREIFDLPFLYGIMCVRVAESLSESVSACSNGSFYLFLIYFKAVIVNTLIKIDMQEIHGTM